MSVEDMILNNVIRADLPDPNFEPELYEKVFAHQRHTCIPRHCGGPTLLGERCHKGFPAPLSETTYEDKNLLRFVYRRTKPEDSG